MQHQPNSVQGDGPPPSIGFARGLFDFSFTTFVTTRIIKVLYGLYLIFVALMLVGGIVGGVMLIVTGNTPPTLGDTDAASPLREGAERAAIGLGILQIVLTPFVCVMAVIYGRVAFECVAVFFRVAEHLGEINRKTRE